MNFPFPPVAQSCPKARPHQAREGGTGGGAASLGPGQLGHGLLGPGSGAPARRQGWSWRTGELKEKGVMTQDALGQSTCLLAHI